MRVPLLDLMGLVITVWTPDERIQPILGLEEVRLGPQLDERHVAEHILGQP